MTTLRAAEQRPGETVSAPGVLERMQQRLPMLRVLGLAATAPILAGLAVAVAVSALALVTAVAGEGSLPNSLGAGVSLWLAAHHVPLTVLGQPLGVLPLAGTAGVLLLLRASAASAVHRLGQLEHPREASARTGLQVMGWFASLHGLIAGVLAALLRAPIIVVEPAQAVVGAAFVAAVGAGWGVARPCGFRTEVARRTPEWTHPALRAAALLAVGMAALGGLTTVLAVALSAGRATELFAASGAIGGLWQLLLAVAYLPNALVAAAAWLLGAGVRLGELHTSVFGFSGSGRLPSLPLLSLLPEQPRRWWLMGLLGPAGLGAVTGWWLRRAAARWWHRAGQAVLAVLLAGAAWLVLSALAGGRLAGGALDPVRVPGGAVLLGMLVWVGLPAAALAAGWVPLRGRMGAAGRAAGENSEAPGEETANSGDTAYGDTAYGDTSPGDASSGETSSGDVGDEREPGSRDEDSEVDEPDGSDSDDADPGGSDSDDADPGGSESEAPDVASSDNANSDAQASDNA